jgi:precorrin-6B methylase 2
MPSFLRFFERFFRPSHVMVGGYRMRLHPDDPEDIGKLRGSYAREMIRAMSDRVRPGDTVIDLGAGVGYFTLHASGIVGAQGRVISFEGDPTSFSILRENVRENHLSQVLPVPRVTVSLDQILKGSEAAVHFIRIGVPADAMRLLDGMRTLLSGTGRLAVLLALREPSRLFSVIPGALASHGFTLYDLTGSRGMREAESPDRLVARMTRGVSVTLFAVR